MVRTAAVVAAIGLAGCSLVIPKPIRPPLAEQPACRDQTARVVLDGLFTAGWGLAGLSAAADERSITLPLLALAAAHAVYGLRGASRNSECRELHRAHEVYLAELEAGPPVDAELAPAGADDAALPQADAPAGAPTAAGSETPVLEPHAVAVDDAPAGPPAPAAAPAAQGPRPPPQPRAPSAACPASECMERVFWREIAP